MEEYVLIRRQRKTLAMRLNRKGEITVFAPPHVPQIEIERFVSSHAAWIEKKRKELSLCAPLPRLNMTQGERVLLFGAEYSLCLHEKRSVLLKDGYIYVPKTNAKAALINYYRKQLKAVLQKAVGHYAKLMGVTPSKIRINSARTRWGSCSAKNALNFSFRLAMCDMSAVEYVVIHELCHILHKNHSKAFWEALAAYRPAFKQDKLYLKQKTYFMEII